MKPSESDAQAPLRRFVYGLLIVCCAATLVGRIWTVSSVWTGRAGHLGSAMLSANDRSRWCTIRSLVHYGTYRIDQVVFDSDGKRNREWYTIDMVQHRGRDGRQHYYSSKPPLLPTLLAGKVWLFRQLTGASLENQPHYVQRLMLMTTNVLPLIVYFVLLAVLVEQLGGTDWGRLFVMTVATWGTFLTTFGVTLNNHLPAAISVLIATYAGLKIVRDQEQRVSYFALAGFFAAFAVANELPALAFFGMVACVLLWRAPRRTLLAFFPSAAVVASGFFLTNYVAHGDWRPPYAHRHDGPVRATLPADLVSQFQPGPLPQTLHARLKAAAIEVSAEASLSESDQPGRWILWDPPSQQRYALVPGTSGLELRSWDNWYEYEGTYWTPAKKSGVDRGEPSRGVYAFHTLLGHRGIFSLTPVWLLSFVGIGIWLIRGETSLRGLAVIVLALTVICLTFYIMRPQADRNYGGVSAGFRWMFWFIPLWLICLLPAADAISRKGSLRAVGWMLLFASVLSASFASLNPWSQSWIFNYWTEMGWIQY